MVSGMPAEWREWAEIGRPLTRILLVWLLAWLALYAIRRVLHAFRQHVERHAALDAREPHDLRRLDTLTNVFRYAANLVVAALALMLTLGQIGISVTPILATAGVAGIAIGFGAQSLVKDFFTGLFLLLENQVNEGDMIEAAGKSGYVERVTLRHVRMRDYDGSVHFIPNGMITTVTNKSREYAYAVTDLVVRRQDDPSRIFAAMRDVAAAMRKDRQFGPSILEDIDIAGVEKLEEAAFTIRSRLKVKPGKQAGVRSEFLRRLKLVLDAQRQ